MDIEEQDWKDALIKRFPEMFETRWSRPEVGAGWRPLVETLVEFLEWDKSAPRVKVLQVKEKFGGLRFYAEGTTEVQRTAISFAEQMSFKICEECGTTSGVTTEGSWKKTLCGGCRGRRE